jgi:hypothetical protein
MRRTPGDNSPPAGLTVADVAKRYRVGTNKVRAWIATGELAAVNTAAPGSQSRWVVLPEALALFERRRAGKAPPKPPRRRRRRGLVDFFPD